MKLDEFKDTISKTDEGRKVSLDCCGIGLEFNKIATNMMMMNVVSREGTIVVSVPYDKVEDNKTNAILSYNDCVRAIVNVDKVRNLWGI